MTLDVACFEYGYESANQLLDDNYAIDAIIAAVDIQGLGIIRALKERGIAVPEQVKVISLTGHAVGGMLQTSMTSMEMPAQEIGEKTAKMIIDDIESERKKSLSQHLILSATLVEREST